MSVEGRLIMVQQACVYCTSNNRKCVKRPQQLYNRLVCIVRVITVSVRSVLNNRGTGLCDCTSNNRKCAKRSQQSWNRFVSIVRVITVSERITLNNRETGLYVLYQ